MALIFVHFYAQCGISSPDLPCLRPCCSAILGSKATVLPSSSVVTHLAKCDWCVSFNDNTNWAKSLSSASAQMISNSFVFWRYESSLSRWISAMCLSESSPRRWWSSPYLHSSVDINTSWCWSRRSFINIVSWRVTYAVTLYVGLRPSSLRCDTVCVT